MQNRIICVGILDFKLNNDQVYPLEFGEALRFSAYEGYNALAAQSMHQRIFDHLKTICSDLYLKETHARTQKDMMPMSFDGMKPISELFVEAYPQYSNHCPEIYTIQDITNENIPILIQGSSPSATFELSIEMHKLLQDANKSNPVINSNETFLTACGDKFIFGKFLEKVKIRTQPYTQLIQLDSFQPNLIQEIDVNCHYIFKIPNGCKGIGSFIVKGNQVETALTALKNRDLEKLKEFGKNEPETFKTILSYWDYTPSKHVLLQEYIPSTPILCENQLFDATGRIVLSIVKTGESLEVKIIDGYWKLPSKPKTDTINISSGISHIVKGYTTRSKLMTNTEIKTISISLNSFMPQLVQTIFETKSSDFLLELLKNNNKAESQYLLKVIADHPMMLDKNFIDEMNKRFLWDIPNRSSYLDFMLEQAKTYYFGHHLMYRNPLLCEWIKEHIELFDQDKATSLITYLQEQMRIANLKHYKDAKYISLTTEILDLLKQQNAPKPQSNQMLKVQ